MEFENRGPLLKPLLLIGGASSRMGTRKELLPFPDGRLSIEHALKTLQSAVPTASTIYISLHNQSQLSAIQPALERFEEQQKIRHSCSHDEEHEHNASTAELQPIFDGQDVEIGPAGGLLAAYSADRKTKWLVLGCDYPLLPPSALQQLMLEYEDPATCFENESGFAEPLIAIVGDDLFPSFAFLLRAISLLLM